MVSPSCIRMSVHKTYGGSKFKFERAGGNVLNSQNNYEIHLLVLYVKFVLHEGMTIVTCTVINIGVHLCHLS